MMRLSEYDSDDLIVYLNDFKEEKDIIRLYKIHREEIDRTYELAMERKKIGPVPPNFIIKCKDGDKVSLPITFCIYNKICKKY